MLEDAQKPCGVRHCNWDKIVNKNQKTPDLVLDLGNLKKNILGYRPAFAWVKQEHGRRTLRPLSYLNASAHNGIPVNYEAWHVLTKTLFLNQNWQMTESFWEKNPVLSITKLAERGARVLNPIFCILFCCQCCQQSALRMQFDWRKFNRLLFSHRIILS